MRKVEAQIIRYNNDGGGGSGDTGQDLQPQLEIPQDIIGGDQVSTPFEPESPLPGGLPPVFDGTTGFDDFGNGGW